MEEIGVASRSREVEGHGESVISGSDNDVEEVGVEISSLGLDFDVEEVGITTGERVGRDAGVAGGMGEVVVGGVVCSWVGFDVEEIATTSVVGSKKDLGTVCSGDSVIDSTTSSACPSSTRLFSASSPPDGWTMDM